MCELEINTYEWTVSGFAYSEDGGFDEEDMEGLCDVTIEFSTDAELC
jgi:hypothetical protein